METAAHTCSFSFYFRKDNNYWIFFKSQVQPPRSSERTASHPLNTNEDEIKRRGDFQLFPED